MAGVPYAKDSDANIWRCPTWLLYKPSCNLHKWAALSFELFEFLLPFHCGDHIYVHRVKVRFPMNFQAGTKAVFVAIDTA